MTPAQARRESKRAKRARALEILARLRPVYPNPRVELDFENPFQLLVATILAAQCTDERVNQVTPALFRRYPDAYRLAAAELPELEEMVRTTGFYRNKARALKAMATALATDHDGEVPPRMEALVDLPGVGRKTANVILGNALGLNEGVVVDTHVTRLSRRLGLTDETDPEKIEADLIPLLPREEWTLWANLLILHGRRLCKARKPECPRCPIADLCPSAEV